MSDYGTTPQDPSQTHPYGQPQQPNPYGQQPAYGEPAAYGQPTYGAPAGLPAGGYASWFKRVGAYLVDGILGALAGFPLWIGYGMLIAGAETTTNANGTTTTTFSGGAAASTLIFIGVVTSLAFWIWNTCIRQGRTGYTIGKGMLGIKLISEHTGQPVGGGMSFVRQLAHIVDSLPCDIGYLWPLWDSKRQTFADKIMKTVVIVQPQG